LKQDKAFQADNASQKNTDITKLSNDSMIMVMVNNHTDDEGTRKFIYELSCCCRSFLHKMPSGPAFRGLFRVYYRKGCVVPGQCLKFTQYWEEPQKEWSRYSKRYLWSLQLMMTSDNNGDEKDQIRYPTIASTKLAQQFPGTALCIKSTAILW